ncbi:MAG: DUF4403 family protein [Geobacteraceae bacterium]|nr:DUF4403 family protein [Geobacteraceae bacterium]
MTIFRFILPIVFLLLCALPATAGAPPSTLNLSITTTATDLAALINRSLPNKLYEGQGMLGTTVIVTRTGPVGVTAADDYINLYVPVQLVFSNTFSQSYPLPAGLRFKVRLQVTADWRIVTELIYTGLSEGLADTIKLGPLSLKPKGAVEGITQPVQRYLAPIIDAKVNDAVRLREKVAPIWAGAFAPVLVSKEYNTWLKLTPERVAMSPIRATDNQVRLALGLVAGAELIVGPKPEGAPPRPLPPVRVTSTIDKGFHLQLGVEIRFADLLAALQPVLIDKTFGTDRKVTVKAFSLKGIEGRLAVCLTTTGAFEGELTILAKPVYNPAENTLTFEEVDFDTRDAGWLVTTGSWLFGSGIRGTIKDKLDSAVAGQLAEARRKADAKLASVRITDRVTLSGTLSGLSPGPATVYDDRLTLQVTARGETGISLK